ncbi:MAG TPA: phosphoribosylglycinamide formyltransferase [Bacteroidales bacterium]|nr:phosphoribosylglycinamide formyltransferase [Bacteroidales bacterium]
MGRLAIFASGSGTNAENIIRYFQNKPQISVSCICTNRSDAYVIERAKRHDIPVLVFSRDEFYQSEIVLHYLRQNEADWIILAGFLWLVPGYLINRYPGRIINIHPALLPKYGGKGMYGAFVHRAVIDNKDTVSGISIHVVNNEYDKGSILFQATCPVTMDDTPETLATKVHQLEYEHFPRVIERVILERDKGQGTRDK